MSVDNSELLAFQNQIQALKDDIPEIMDSLAVGEGRYARDQARKICKEENIVTLATTDATSKAEQRRSAPVIRTKSTSSTILTMRSRLNTASEVTSFLATGREIPSSTRETTLTAECTSDRPAAMFAVISPFGAL